MPEFSVNPLRGLFKPQMPGSIGEPPFVKVNHSVNDLTTYLGGKPPKGDYFVAFNPQNDADLKGVTDAVNTIVTALAKQEPPVHALPVVQRLDDNTTGVRLFTGLMADPSSSGRIAALRADTVEGAEIESAGMPLASSVEYPNAKELQVIRSTRPQSERQYPLSLVKKALSLDVNGMHPWNYAEGGARTVTPQA
jgi:hypothetical protein